MLYSGHSATTYPQHHEHLCISAYEVVKEQSQKTFKNIQVSLEINKYKE